MFAAQQHSTQSGSSLFFGGRGSSSRANEKKNNNKTTQTMRKTPMRIQRGSPVASIPQQGGNAQPRESLSLCLSL